MNKNRAKQIILEKLRLVQGKELLIRVNLGRNKYISFKGIIKEIYPFLFTVEESENKFIHSFSYSDIITKNLELKMV